MTNQAFRIVVAGGGTGGHVQPAIAVTASLREMADVQITWIGSMGGVEKDAAASRGIPFRVIPTGKLRRYVSVHTLIDSIRVPIGIARARMHLRDLRPDVIFSTGGFVSVPTVIAGWMAGIPIITHEQTATAGLANRINARLADRIALAFEDTASEFAGQNDRIVVTGNPVRPELLNGDAGRLRSSLNLPKELPVVYVTGGSLGAQAINQCVGSIVPSLVSYTAVIHQCGPSSANGDYPRLLEVRQSLPDDLRDRYILRERIRDQLPDVYDAAALVVGRAGAGTIAEIAMLGKPSILIPLPGASSDEQTRNARMLANAGAAILIPQAEMTPERLRTEIFDLMGDENLRAEMSAIAKTRAQPDAARLLAQEILALAGRGAVPFD